VSFVSDVPTVALAGCAAKESMEGIVSVTRIKRELWAGGASVCQRVLVVDDDPLVRRSLGRLLERQGYETACAGSAADASRLLDEQAFDLALCDIRMPGESGLALVERVAADHPGVAVIMVSGLDDQHVAETALELGAYDYVLKPFRPNEVFVAVANALRRRKLQHETQTDRQRMLLALLEHRGALRSANADLEEHKALLRRARRQTMCRLARAAELRDKDIGQHLERVGRYSEVLAHRLGLDADRCEVIGFASRLHDIGKIGIPDRILLKPGTLDEHERAVIEQHTQIGHSLLTDADDESLELAATIALTHHERVDGAGYPRGLVADAIPLEGRIVAVADAFDALTSRRPYRPALGIEQAVEVILAQRGTQFDARLVGLFVECVHDLRRIGERLRDRPAAASASEEDA
jgi:response regulator RpfG family c-di-GMP phosphodiesterase